MTAPAAAVEDLTSEHWKDDFRQLLCNKKFNFELFKSKSFVRGFPKALNSCLLTRFHFILSYEAGFFK